MKEYLRTKLRNFVLRHRDIFTHNLFFPAEPQSNDLIIGDLKTAAIAPDGLPATPQDLWVGYGNTLDVYIESGANNVATMFSILGKSDYKNVLDFGCAAGRMIRHIKSDGWGVDISARHINWCKQNLPHGFATITTVPHLPFRDDSFDLVFAGSVFTHLDDLADAWLLELGRVCSGDVFLTIHDENTMRLLQTKKYRDLYVAGKLDGHTPNFKMLSIGRDTDSQVFYSREHFQKMFERVFDLTAIVDEAYGPHTAFAGKKRS